MDLSDLSADAIKRIAKAEIEAEYILREPDLTGLASELNCEQLVEGAEVSVRNQAAAHLFDATARELWERVRPDLDRFKARLAEAKKWVDNKFHPDPSVLKKAAAGWRKLARREVAKNRTAPKLQVRPRGLLGAAMMQRQQALKEGRLEGYVDLPSEAQTFVPSGIAGVAYPPLTKLPATELVPLVPVGNVGRKKRLSGVVTSPRAARRMEVYMESKGMGQTEFAAEVLTTDRTLRTFRKTGKVRRDIFRNIAKAMGTSAEELMKPE